MDTNWIDRRKGYSYSGFLFSEDGTRAKEFGAEYREKLFPASQRKRFNIWLVTVLLLIFLGMPLLVYFGLQDKLFLIGAIVLGFAYWLHGRIHVCSLCGRKSRALKTPHMGAPVLYLCNHCHTFFEHGAIDGGLPWK